MPEDLVLYRRATRLGDSEPEGAFGFPVQHYAVDKEGVEALIWRWEAKIRKGRSASQRAPNSALAIGVRAVPPVEHPQGE